MRRVCLATALLGAFVLAGCGNALSGTYKSNSRAIFKALTFKSGNKVELSTLRNSKELTYVIEGDKVKITEFGQSLVFTIDNAGCLEGGEVLGKYCKS